LVELVLATTIAMLLLGALYVAVDMQLRFAQNSRDLVEESTLARAILARIDSDASQVVGLSDPGRFRIAAGADALSDPNATTVAASTTPAASTTATTTGAASSTASTATATTDSGTSTNILLPLGVQGDSETLHLYVSRVPRELYSNINSDTPPVVSDLRRVSYWLLGGADNPAGLARQEVPIVTSDDALQNLPPGVENEGSFLIAEEVRSLTFQYFDGTSWQDNWDSTTPGADGVTPIGSPRAVAVTVGVARPGANGNVKIYRHVIAIASANGTTQQAPAPSSAGGGATP
jgi:hypothetical protein